MIIANPCSIYPGKKINFEYSNEMQIELWIDDFNIVMNTLAGFYLHVKILKSSVDASRL